MHPSVVLFETWSLKRRLLYVSMHKTSKENKKTYVPDLIIHRPRRRRPRLRVFIYLLPKRLESERVFFNLLLEGLKVGLIV